MAHKIVDQTDKNKNGIVEARIDYYPRVLQRELHDSLKRFNVLVCHRRFGKTVFCANEIVKQASSCTSKDPLYAYLAPYRNQAKNIAWKIFKHSVKNIPEVKINESELKITLPNGAEILLLGAENPHALRGLGLDGVVLDEVAQIPPSVWESVIRPTLSDKHGWAIFIGTPMGQNYFYELYNKAVDRDNWFRALYKASETGIINEDELVDLRVSLGPDVFAQEYECSWVAAIKGAYYSSLLAEADKANRIGDVNWDPALPVITSWDIGMSDKTCIWFFQQKNNNVYAIDYYENSGEVLSHYAQIVTSKPYSYAYHILPHDAQQRSFETGKTRIEQLKSLGLKTLVAPKTNVLDGINAVRAMLPRCYFDKKKCKAGLEAMWHYRSEYDGVKQVFSNKPLHDWSSHASDSFRYMAVGIRKELPGINMQRHLEFQRQFQPEKLNMTAWDPFDSELDNSKFKR